jgi:UPF0755 protein
MRAVKAAFFFVALVALAAAGFLSLLRAPSGEFPREGVFVEVPRGASVRAVGRALEQNGLVRSGLAFEIYARWKGQSLQAGEYRFGGPAPVFAVHQKLARGQIFQQPFTVPEGLTMFQIADRVAEARLGTREEFLEAARDATLMRDLAPRTRNLEGFLFPATYFFARKATAREVVEKMAGQFRAEWEKMEGGQGPGGLPVALTAYEQVTLASLVERETPAAAERPMVAAVFYNRLRQRLPLQCDPTVLYAMELAGKNDGIIHQSDLRLKSPYNTYLNRGLPPGPIGNPGRGALEAVRRPAAVDYLYFVADGQGGHVFSKTLAEHNRNVARYRRLVSQQRANGSSGGANGARGSR